jgi:hypothetical protein
MEVKPEGCGNEPRGTFPRRRSPPAYRSCKYGAAGRASRVEGGSHCSPADGSSVRLSGDGGVKGGQGVEA